MIGTSATREYRLESRIEGGTFRKVKAAAAEQVREAVRGVLTSGGRVGLAKDPTPDVGAYSLELLSDGKNYVVTMLADDGVEDRAHLLWNPEGPDGTLEVQGNTWERCYVLTDGAFIEASFERFFLEGDLPREDFV